MDPLSITVGTLQIISFCVQCAGWIANLKTVDERVQAFASEIETLSAHHDALTKALQSPGMIAVARAAEQNAGGGLWKQVMFSLNDCKNTMQAVANILKDIDRNSKGPLRRPQKQFKESLAAGDLAKLRQRIQFFNSTISLPLQIMTVYQQIEQRDVGAQHQQRLEAKIERLQRMVARLGNRISTANQTSPISGEDEKIYEHLGSCVVTAQRFLSSASAASSNGSGTGTVAPQIRQAEWVSIAGGSVFGETLSLESRGRIESWVRPAEGGETESLDGPRNSRSFCEESDVNTMEEQEALAVPSTRDDNIDLDLDLTRNFLKLGQEKAESQEHARAEAFFRKALKLISTHNFQDGIALHPAEVQLMLGCACLKQKKFGEAESIFLPLTKQNKDCDEYQSLTASHFLGDLYLQKGELQQALSCTMGAVKGRNNLMGSKHAAFVESLRLLLQVYKEMGDEAEVEAWQKFLPTKPSVEEPATVSSAEDKFGPASDISDSTTNTGKSVPSTEKSGKGRFTLSFRKTPRPDAKTLRPVSLDFLEKPLIPSGSAASSIKSPNTWSPALSPVTTFATTSEYGCNDDPFFSDPTLSQSSTLNDVSVKSLSKSPSRTPTNPLAFGYNSIKVTQEQAAAAAFTKIRDLCDRGHHKKAAKESLSFLKVYMGKSEILFDREITENIRHSGKLGLAGTGRGYAPVHFFASLAAERPFEIGLLIEQGVDVNATDLVLGDPRSSPETPLLLAVAMGHSRIVERLLEVQNIDIEHKGLVGMTALFMAFDYGHAKIVELLIQHGANAILKENGQTSTTLLHQAASRYDSNTIRHLLARGEVVDSLDKKSRTPLMCALDSYAAPSRNSLSSPSPRLNETLSILLDAGADSQLKDMDGHSAMSRALEGSLWEVAKALEKKSTPLLAIESLNSAITLESIAQG